MQCAAVRIVQVSKIAPPQKWKPNIRETCHGNWVILPTLVPPTILSPDKEGKNKVLLGKYMYKYM